VTEHQPTFTVLTPTYNRAQTLPRVYESLSRQTYTDFEWLIVDDGSADGTSDLVRRWQGQAPLRIRCVKMPENRGIPAARNRGIEEARGRFVVMLDSDDACLPQSLERFKFHWDSIPEGERDGFVGVTTLCNDQHGNPVGSDLHTSPLDSDSLEMRHRYRYRHEMWGMQRVDVLRRYPFPGIRGASEAVAWFEIARRYRTRFFQDRLRTYYIDEPGRRDQSGHAPIRDRAEGRILYQKYVLNRTIDWFRCDPRYFLIAAVQYARFSFHGGRSPARQLAGLSDALPLALGLATLPLGFAVYVRDRRRERRVPAA
jgi:glycosyltransferase involved in cell wall biosynthesis